MQASRSELDSASHWHTHIPTHIHILIMHRPFMWGRRFTGIMGIAFLLREVLMCTVFTTSIMGNPPRKISGTVLSQILSVNNVISRAERRCHGDRRLSKARLCGFDSRTA
jgi:hypothetical protein